MYVLYTHITVVSSFKAIMLDEIDSILCRLSLAFCDRRKATPPIVELVAFLWLRK